MRLEKIFHFASTVLIKERRRRTFTLTSPPLLSSVLGTDYCVLLVSFRPNMSFDQISSAEWLQVGLFHSIVYQQVKIAEASVRAR